MNHTVKISILVAIYNADNYLKDCLDSLVNQSLKEIQIICINDGSTDNSKIILDKYSTKDNRIIVLHQKNKGASAARNYGIKHSSGEYICMVDADDYISLDCLEKAYDTAITYDLDATIFNLEYFGSNQRFNNNYHSKVISGKEATILSLDWSISGIGLFRSDIIKKNKYNMTTMNGDELSTRQFFIDCDKVGFSEGKYFYRQHPESTTKKFSPKLFETLNTSNIIRKLLIENNIYDEAKERFEKHHLQSYTSLLLLYLAKKRKLLPNDAKRIEKELEKAYYEFDFMALRKLNIEETGYRKILFWIAIKSKSYLHLKAMLIPISLLFKIKSGR